MSDLDFGKTNVLAEVGSFHKFCRFIYLRCYTHEPAGTMFGTKERICVKIKLFSGLDRQAKVDNYDPDTGIDLQILKGARLKKVFKAIGLSHSKSTVCFINGKKAGLHESLNNGDVVFFMRPASGG